MGKSDYLALINAAPDCGAADHVSARKYLELLRRATLEGGPWTRHQMNHIGRLRGIWRLRAEGLDRRFEIVGTRRGRLQLRDEIKLLSTGV